MVLFEDMKLVTFEEGSGRYKGIQNRQMSDLLDVSRIQSGQLDLDCNMATR